MEAPPPRRSSSRSKRSSTNLANLRLAPLSSKYSPPTSGNATPKIQSPSPDISYAVQHSSYIQGRSAPTTPGILSRSSSRKHLSGGLSRKLSIYDTDTPYYAAVEVTPEGYPKSALRLDTQGIPKAKSEAALLVEQRLGRRHVKIQHEPTAKLRHHRRAGTGPRKEQDDDWFTRAGLATSSLLRENKGQSWLVSRESSTSLAHQVSDSEDESIPVLGTSTPRLQYADDEFSPSSPRFSRWGSRFGSRVQSARNSRRGSTVELSRTPLAEPRQGHGVGYFDDRLDQEDVAMMEPDFVGVDEDTEEDAEEEIRRLAKEKGTGLGRIVDHLVGWSLFDVSEDKESEVEEEDKGHGSTTMRDGVADERKRRMKGDIPRVRPPGRTAEAGEAHEGGWQDAAWLLSVASKVLL